MNGISVMACVQTEQSGFRNVYGRENRMQQKYIMISRQNEGKGAAGMKAGGPSISGHKSAAAMQETRIDRTADPDARRGAIGRQAEGRQTEGGQTEQKRVKKTAQHCVRSSGRTGAGRGGSAFALRTLILAVIFAGMLAGFQMMTRASSREKELTYKYYTTVTIGYGEDLSDVVYQYCDNSEYASADDYLREICEINSLPYHKGTVPDLKAGAKVVIPYFSTEVK